MKKTLLFLLCAAFVVASPVAAGTIVTWQGTGEVTQSWPNQGFPQPFPSVGTTLSMTLSFDPSTAVSTPSDTPGTAGCMTVGFSGSMTLGGYTYSSGPSVAFTHAALPVSNCVPPGGVFDGGDTQFAFQGLQTPPDSPWVLGSGRLLILTYRDSLVQDAFPDAPTAPLGADVWLIDLFNDGRWGFNGHVDLQAVDQATPVPEPGTMMLLGLGLAAAYRRRRSSQEP